MKKKLHFVQSSCSSCQKEIICHDDMRVLFEVKSGECIEFFEMLKHEVFHLSVFDYYNKYYNNLRKLIYFMKNDYPKIDMSPSDIDLLYERIHMRDK